MHKYTFSIYVPTYLVCTLCKINNDSYLSFFGKTYISSYMLLIFFCHIKFWKKLPLKFPISSPDSSLLTSTYHCVAMKYRASDFAWLTLLCWKNHIWLINSIPWNCVYTRNVLIPHFLVELFHKYLIKTKKIQIGK